MVRVNKFVVVLVSLLLMPFAVCGFLMGWYFYLQPLGLPLPDLSWFTPFIWLNDVIFQPTESSAILAFVMGMYSIVPILAVVQVTLYVLYLGGWSWPWGKKLTFSDLKGGLLWGILYLPLAVIGLSGIAIYNLL